MTIIIIIIICGFIGYLIAKSDNKKENRQKQYKKEDETSEEWEKDLIKEIEHNKKEKEQEQYKIMLQEKYGAEIEARKQELEKQKKEKEEKEKRRKEEAEEKKRKEDEEWLKIYKEWAGPFYVKAKAENLKIISRVSIGHYKNFKEECKKNGGYTIYYDYTIGRNEHYLQIPYEFLNYLEENHFIYKTGEKAFSFHVGNSSRTSWTDRDIYEPL